MQVNTTETTSKAFRFSVSKDGHDVAHGFLYVIYNDLHGEPYGLVEDVFVEESHRKNGYGTEILQAIIAKAKEIGCYKLLAQSRHGKERVHVWYKRLGFSEHGLNFRMDL